MIPSHKWSLCFYFNDCFYVIICAPRKGAWNTINSPSPYKTVLLPNHSSLLGYVYNMWSFYSWYLQIYFIFLFVFEIMQGIKDWNSTTLANLLKALAFLYTFNCMKPMINIRYYNEQCHDSVSCITNFVWFSFECETIEWLSNSRGTAFVRSVDLFARILTQLISNSFSFPRSARF